MIGASYLDNPRPNIGCCAFDDVNGKEDMYIGQVRFSSYCCPNAFKINNSPPPHWVVINLEPHNEI